MNVYNLSTSRLSSSFAYENRIGTPNLRFVVSWRVGPTGPSKLSVTNTMNIYEQHWKTIISNFGVFKTSFLWLRGPAEFVAHHGHSWVIMKYLSMVFKWFHSFNTLSYSFCDSSSGRNTLLKSFLGIYLDYLDNYRPPCQASQNQRGKWYESVSFTAGRPHGTGPGTIAPHRRACEWGASGCESTARCSRSKQSCLSSLPLRSETSGFFVKETCCKNVLVSIKTAPADFGSEFKELESASLWPRPSFSQKTSLLAGLNEQLLKLQ